MAGSENIWLRGICGGMELCWLFAGSLFLVSATAGTVAFPLVRSGLLFVLAALLTGYRHRTGDRRIWKVAAHLLLLTAMVAMALRSAGLTFCSGSVYGVYQAGLVCLLMTAFWYKGMMLARRKLSYESVCNHCDLGIAAFLALMVLNLLIVIKDGQPISGNATLMLGIVFFMCALTAVFRARTSGSGEKKYRKEFAVLGTLISAGWVPLLAGAGMWIFFQPGMNQVTRDGYDWFLQAVAPLKPYIIGMLKALLTVSGNSPRPSAPPGESGGMKWGNLYIPDPEAHWIDSAVRIGFAGLALLMLVITVVILAVVLYRWLMARGSGKGSVRSGRSFFRTVFHWLYHIRTLLPGRWMSRKKAGVVFGYHALVRWGHRSGISMRVNETPLEYGVRLSEQFVPLGREIHTIVHSFCLEVYGHQNVSGDTVHSVKTAVRLIRHPRFWPMRIKSFLRQRFLISD